MQERYREIRRFGAALTTQGADGICFRTLRICGHTLPQNSESNVSAELYDACVDPEMVTASVV